MTTLFKNFDTMSFLDLIMNYNLLLNNGYNKVFLNQNLHTLLSFPFFTCHDCNCIDFGDEYIEEIK